MLLIVTLYRFIENISIVPVSNSIKSPCLLLPQWDPVMDDPSNLPPCAFWRSLAMFWSRRGATIKHCKDWLRDAMMMPEPTASPSREF